MKKLKVATIVGTRPEIIRLSSVIKKLSNSKSIDHYLVHTGQNYDYELNQIFFDDLNLKKPDYFFEINPSSSIENIGNIIIQTENFLNENTSFKNQDLNNVEDLRNFDINNIRNIINNYKKTF